LKIIRVFGRQDDSLEYKLTGWGTYSLDLFWMYHAKNYSWLGIQTFDKKHTKKISVYPDFRKICTGELHGYRVYVPCDTRSIIETEYGKQTWFEPKTKYRCSYD
jgi:hypothetical protein